MLHLTHRCFLRVIRSWSGSLNIYGRAAHDGYASHVDNHSKAESLVDIRRTFLDFLENARATSSKVTQSPLCSFIAALIKTHDFALAKTLLADIVFPSRGAHALDPEDSLAALFVYEGLEGTYVHLRHVIALIVEMAGKGRIPNDVLFKAALETALDEFDTEAVGKLLPLIVQHASGILEPDDWQRIIMVYVRSGRYNDGVIRALKTCRAHTIAIGPALFIRLFKVILQPDTADLETLPLTTTGTFDIAAYPAARFHRLQEFLLCLKGSGLVDQAVIKALETICLEHHPPTAFLDFLSAGMIKSEDLCPKSPPTEQASAQPINAN